MKRKLFPALVVAGLVASMSLAASATPGPPPGTTTSAQTITATVLASCTVTQNGQLNFPEYKPAGNPAHSLTADIAHTYDAGSADAIMQCTANTPFNVSVPSTHSLMHGTAHPAATLAYTYNVLGTFSPVGSPPNVHCPVNNTTNNAGGTTDPSANPVQIEFAGCIEHGLWPTPDIYTDTFTFTVTF
jgi:spore coat protein U-like protein